jgi:hypothetical protein
MQILRRQNTTKTCFFQDKEWAWIHRQILATKIHKGAQRKKDKKNHLNKKFLGVQKGLAAQAYLVNFPVFFFSPITNDI